MFHLFTTTIFATTITKDFSLRERFQLPKNDRHLSRWNSWNMLHSNGIFDLSMSQYSWTPISISISKAWIPHILKFIGKRFGTSCVWSILFAAIFCCQERIWDGYLIKNMMLVNYVKLHMTIKYYKCYDSHAKTIQLKYSLRRR